MGQPRIYKVKMELDFATTPALKVRVWDPPSHTPFRDMTIFVSTGGQVLPAGTLNWSVLYGGHWAGVPFADGSTHLGGVIKDSGTIVGAVEIAELMYESDDILPANNCTGANNMFRYSTPVVLELENDGVLGYADPITLFFTFCSETIATNV
jgi:hypothetical protein